MVFLIQQLLTFSAQRNPKGEAVVFGNQSISYGELEAITNKFANRLINEGVKKGDRVGIYLHKSIEAIISIFAILKTGATYVPLPPTAPIKRISYITKDCGIRFLMSNPGMADNILQLIDDDSPIETVFNLEEDLGKSDSLVSKAKLVEWNTVMDSDEEQLPPNTNTSFDLAYILYTSGSTGDPKGVMISHLNALTFINWGYECFKLDVKDRVLNNAPLHFDLSIFDIFVTVKAAATLVLVPEGTSSFPIMLCKLIEGQKITVCYFVPSAWIHLMVHGNLGKYNFDRLRLILFAGEVFPVKYLRELMETIPHAKYYNLYGPTETNVCTFYHVRNIPPENAEDIPIGKACSNIEVFALNGNNELILKPGERAELCVRGPCVAQGYWGDPDKTRSAFVPNILRTDFEERMYRTGDIVTVDEEGNYHLIGRGDHMIKSRGYRIELGEIESVLYNHCKVREAVAFTIPDEHIGNKIKISVVPVKAQSLTRLELEKHCSEFLPGYMIPEIIEFRQFLPRTSTGKVDRQLLASENKASTQNKRKIVRKPKEERIA